MDPALRHVLLADPMPWAMRADYAWDFIKNRARFRRANVGRPESTPGWSFTRASTGYAQNAAGVLIPFASGEMRRTDKGLLIEGTATNLCRRSGDLTHAAWTAASMTVAMNAVGPDGVANSAATLTATGANATLKQAFTIASAIKNGSFYLRRVTGSGNIDMTLNNGSTWTTKTLTTSWQRFDISQTLANPTLGLRIVTSGDVIEAAFPQMEATAYATSYIPTAGATATRAGDAVSIAGATWAAPLTLFGEAEPNVLTGNAQRFIAVSDGTSSNRIQTGIGATAQMGGIVVTDGTPVPGTGATDNPATIGAVAKSGFAAATDDVRSYGNGIVAFTPVTSATMPSGLSLVHFGSTTGTSQFLFGYLRRAAIFSRALTNAELQALTA